MVSAYYYIKVNKLRFHVIYLVLFYQKELEVNTFLFLFPPLPYIFLPSPFLPLFSPYFQVFLYFCIVYFDKLIKWKSRTTIRFLPPPWCNRIIWCSGERAKIIFKWLKFKEIEKLCEIPGVSRFQAIRRLLGFCEILATVFIYLKHYFGKKWNSMFFFHLNLQISSFSKQPPPSWDCIAIHKSQTERALALHRIITSVRAHLENIAHPAVNW